MDDVRIASGDAVERLREMPDESVQCIVTSPPFWALRDYGTGSWEGGDEGCDHTKPTRHQVQGATSQRKGRASVDAQRNETFTGTCERCGAVRVDRQIGLEETPEEWVAALVRVFRECRRVLRSDGVMWLEVGDTYANDEKWGGSSGGKNGYAASGDEGYRQRRSTGLKGKDLVGAPWMLAFALRADGWWLRSEVIWDKLNPMPESVTDRPTTSHSRVFLLTKNDRYFFDADAIRSPHKHDGRKVTAVLGGDGSLQHRDGERWPGLGANARTVWSIASEPTPFAHFATFPQKLVERCLKAGTSEKGACASCGAPWRRVVEASGGTIGQGWHDHTDDLTTGQLNGASSKGMATYRREERGWEPTCEHPAAVVPCVVLDPFMGSGTTALVARRLGRYAVGVELNDEYIRIAEKRLQQLSLLV